MTRRVEFQLEDMSKVVVEVEEPESSGDVRVARMDIIEPAKQKFEEAIAILRPVAVAVITNLRDLAQAPEEIGLDFGFKLTAEAGAVIAKTASEGHFKVSLKWKSEGKED